MKTIDYTIGYNDSINRWWTTGMETAPYDSPIETFEAEVNLEESYVQIEYPVRKAFVQENKIDAVHIYEGDYPKLYTPFEGNRVDFTTFIKLPHYCYFYAKTKVMAKEAGTYPFDIYTCGGVKLWVNGEEITCYKPYTRNIASKQSVELPLREGDNDIVVYADELAERDVFFYYELRYKGEAPLMGRLEVEEEPARYLQTEAFLTSCYFPEDVVEEGQVRIEYDGALLTEPMTVKVRLDDRIIERKLESKDSAIELFDVNDGPVGVYQVQLIATVGEAEILRELVVALRPKAVLTIEPAETLEARKAQALDFTAKYGEKVVTRTLAILETEGDWTPEAEAFFMDSLRMIETKQDCADFYIVPMFLLMKRYADLVPVHLFERLEEALLNFRYWIDEPGNDVMWYFSENHAFLFHIAQYLAGDRYSEEEFSVSGRLGQEQYDIGYGRLIHWFDTFFSYGYAEWNSATYIPIDLIGFFALYELAPDEKIRTLAKQALDFTFEIIAYNTFEGVMSSSYGRAYEHTLKGRQLVEPNFISWISYGEGYVTSSTRAVAMYGLSSYEPPEYHLDMDVDRGEWISGELEQGIIGVKTYFYRTKDYFISSVQDFKSFTHGHQQHVMNVALGKESVQFFINHPGEKLYSGGNRPSYWAGNGTLPYIMQRKNTMLMVYTIDPEELVHGIHAYGTTYLYDSYVCDDKWFFARVGESYLGTYFSNGYRLVRQGANKSKEILSDGLCHGVVVTCGSKEEYGSFDAFMEAKRTMSIDYNGGKTMTIYDDRQGMMSVGQSEEKTVNRGNAHVYIERGRLDGSHTE